MSGSAADYRAVRIDGKQYKLADGTTMPFRALDRLASKITVGDYSLDSNDLLSAWILSDFTGGQGIADHQEGTTDNRYRWSSLYTRYPKQLSKNYATVPFTTGSGATYPIGDMYYSNAYEYYAVSGTTLYKDNTTTTLAITGAPTNLGEAWSGTSGTTLLYIPQGTNGYTTYNRGAGTRQNNTGAGNLFVDFVVWDDKLVGIDTTGQLRYATAAAAVTAFTSYGAQAKLDDSKVPKRLHVHRNQSGDPTIFVVSDQDVWALDADIPRIYKIPDLESPHPEFGSASCVWRGALYVATGGLGVDEYSGGVIRPMGLDRDDGVEPGLTGSIVSLIPGYNSLYAVVSGTLASSVHEWTGFGWHLIYHQGLWTPTWGTVSRVSSAYRLYWGQTASNGDQYRMPLPKSTFNPRAAADNAVVSFGYQSGGSVTRNAVGYYLESGMFDAGMEGYTKIANAVQIRIRDVATDDTVNIAYRTATNEAYTDIGAGWTSPGTYVAQFGTADAQNVKPGLPFQQIELRIQIAEGGSPTGLDSIVEAVVFSFLKVQNPSLAWDPFTLDLSTTSPDGVSPENQLAALTDLRTSYRFYALEYNGTTYRGRIAGMSGQEGTADDTRSMVSISFVEIPEELGVPGLVTEA